MYLITQYSDSHRELVNKFISPYCHTFDSVRMIHVPQICETGTYGQAGFNEHMYLKLDCLLTVPLGTPTLYLDADCLILPQLADWCRQWIKKHQDILACGNDSDSHSMGVLLFVQTEQTIKWWKRLKDTGQALDLHDQEALNWILNNDKATIKLGLLPKNIFANWSPGEPWKGEPINPPPEMLCWHANYCIGVQNKLKMLTRVQECVLS